MNHQIPIPQAVIINDSGDSSCIEVSNDIAYKRLLFVNVVFLGDRTGWVLIDAGIRGSASFIKNAAKARFGNVKPEAIILTHGHFDHVGALKSLAEEWDIPVFAHELELSFLTGNDSYQWRCCHYYGAGICLQCCYAGS